MSSSAPSASNSAAASTSSNTIPPISGISIPTGPIISPPTYFNKFAFRKNGMDYISLGSTGAIVSRVALGLMSYATERRTTKWQEWVIPGSEGEKFVKQALDAGINFFDTAEMYSEGGSELFFGEALKKLLPHSRFTRSDLFISTKIFPNRTYDPTSDFGGLQRSLSRKAIFDAVENSLKRLQLDYIDLYFIHRYDINTSPEETMKALHDLVQAGKIRYIGASSMWTWQLNKLQQAAERNGWTKFTVMQNHYNAVYREEERDMIPYCLDSGVTLTPYSPLAAGVLARTENPDAAPSTRQQVDIVQRSKYYKQGDDAVIAAVRNVAQSRGIPPAHVALAWLWSKPAVGSTIIGATKPHHISDAAAATQIKLTAEELQSIDKEYQPHAIVGHA